MQIAEVAEKYKLSQDSLHYYERIGLIPPVNRTRGGIRDYTEEDERRVEFMTCMRSAGLSIESLVEYVALFRKGDHTKDARKELLLDQRRALVGGELFRIDTVEPYPADYEEATGYLGYPVLQAADILLYKGEVVPVGEDQLSHVEITREIARDFNRQYGDVFPEPAAKLTKFARLPGLDGKKMSKSLNNAIMLSDEPDEVKKKMKKAVTDPQKIRKGDPGRPDVCLVFTYHKKFNASEEQEIRTGCESGQLGCVDCKMRAAERINTFLDPFRERRKNYENNPEKLESILKAGEEKARAVADKTMSDVHKAMKMG